MSLLRHASAYVSKCLPVAVLVCMLELCSRLELDAVEIDKYIDLFLPWLLELVSSLERGFSRSSCAPGVEATG